MTGQDRLTRHFQRNAAEREVRVGDPLKLPFARILQDVQGIRLSDAYHRLVMMAACAMTLGRQEDLYLSTIKGLERRDLDVLVRSFQQLVLDMDDRPFVDLLGPLHMAIASHVGKQMTGEFYTPHSVSRLMGQLIFGTDLLDQFPEDGPLTLHEPACGTGSMILAMAEVMAEQGISLLHTRWTVQDLSATSCYAVFVNTSLWGIPAQVTCGNTLTLECHWSWRNIWFDQARALPRETPEEQARFGRLVTGMRQFLAESPELAQVPA